MAKSIIISMSQRTAFGKNVPRAALFALFQKKEEVIDMGRKGNLKFADDALLDATTFLREIRVIDVGNRKSKALARLKPKYTADIKKLDLLLTTIVTARKLLKRLPKAVQ